MRKSLSILLAITLVFSMFGSLAFAAEAELTAQQKYEALAAKGIFAGINAEGDAGLDQPMNRAQFARVAALILGLDGIGATDTKVVTVKPFSDVGLGLWYTEEVAAVKEAGLFVGNGDGTFNPIGNISVQELAVVVVGLLGLTPVADAEVTGAASWAADDIQAIINAGLDFPTNYTEAAIRSDLASMAFTADALINVPAVAGVKSIAQTGVKKITVEFSKALTDAEKADLTYEVKYGFVPYTVTATYADDNKSAALESSFNFPAGEYTVTVKGFDAQTITIAAEKVTSVEIGAVNLQKAAGQDLKIKALNQFGEAITGAIVDANVSVYNGTLGAPVTVSGLKVDLSAAAIDNTIIVTVTHPTTGLSATKTYKVVAASTVTSMTFGPVAPKTDKTRITVGETGLEIPYTLVDQYGESLKLPSTDLTFISSNTAIVDTATFTVTDGKLTYTAGATAGTAIITVLNAKSGATTNFTIKVEDNAKVKTFLINHPGVLIAANESVTIPFAATDSFDLPFTTADFAQSGNSSQVTLTSSNPAVILTSYGFDSKTGVLTINLSAAGQTTLYAWVGGTIAGQIALDVKAAAVPTKITGIKDVNTLFTKDGSVTLDYKKNVVAVDNYGRAIADLSTFAGYDFNATVVEATYYVDATGTNGKTLIGLTAAGSNKIKLTLNNGTDVANSSYEFSVKNIVAGDVKTYELAAIADIYAAGTHTKTIALTGMDASGNKVNINQSTVITQVTSSNPTVASVSGSVITGLTKGTSTIVAWQNGTKLAEVVVNVVDAAPVVTTIEITGTVEVANSATTQLTQQGKDQYGVNLGANGVWSSSDITIAGVSTTGLVTSTAKDGEATITFVSDNGVSNSVVVTVN